MMMSSSCSNLSLLLALLLLSTATKVNGYGGRIHLHVKYVEGGKTSDLEGAEVQCWDEDKLDADDRMTHVVKTNKEGKAMLYYKQKEGSNFWEPFRGWDPWWENSNPDIYCVIKKPGVIYPFHTKTKMNVNQNDKADFHTVHVYPDRVKRGDPGKKNGCGPYWMPKEIRDMADLLLQQKDTCDIHDLCYHSCIETMLTCDDELKAIGYSRCNDMFDHWATKHACKLSVDVMYQAIRDNGASAFKNSRNCPKA